MIEFLNDIQIECNLSRNTIEFISALVSTHRKTTSSKRIQAGYRATADYLDDTLHPYKYHEADKI